jgi:hypothetical protein
MGLKSRSESSVDEGEMLEIACILAESDSTSKVVVVGYGIRNPLNEVEGEKDVGASFHFVNGCGQEEGLSDSNQ